MFDVCTKVITHTKDHAKSTNIADVKAAFGKEVQTGGSNRKHSGSRKTNQRIGQQVHTFSKSGRFKEVHRTGEPVDRQYRCGSKRFSEPKPEPQIGTKKEPEV